MERGMPDCRGRPSSRREELGKAIQRKGRSSRHVVDSHLPGVLWKEPEAMGDNRANDVGMGDAQAEALPLKAQGLLKRRQRSGLGFFGRFRLPGGRA